MGVWSPVDIIRLDERENQFFAGIVEDEISRERGRKVDIFNQVDFEVCPLPLVNSVTRYYGCAQETHILGEEGPLLELRDCKDFM